MTDPKTAEVKVVPVEPTEAMERAAFDVLEVAPGSSGFVTGTDARNAVWSAMLAASPPAETGEGAVEWLRGQRRIQASAAVRNGDKTVNHTEIVGFIDLAIAALSAQPVSPSEGEAWGWAVRQHADAPWSLWKGPEPHAASWSDVIPLYTHPASDQSDTARMRAGDLLWYDMGQGSRVRCTYRGDCEGWPLVTFDADHGSDDPQPVRPSRVSPRAALAEKAADK